MVISSIGRRLRGDVCRKSLLLLYQPSRKVQKLADVGILTSPKVNEDYQPGQLFLHRYFGYRGVVLYRWPAYLFDSDSNDAVKNQSDKAEAERYSNKVIYYQVLVDQRDAPHVKMQRDSITFLGNSAEEPLYSLPGFDYLSHDDILPYNTTDKQPIKHNFFNKFFEVDDRNGSVAFNPRDSLRSWQDKNHRFLELSAVYRSITNDIQITVMPFYMGSRNFVTKNRDMHYYWWRYCIRIENLGTIPIRLLNRHWMIQSANNLEEVHGRGVVGMMPVLTAVEPAFQYSSHVSLKSSSGHMWGSFNFERLDELGTTYCRIPMFNLDSR